MHTPPKGERVVEVNLAVMHSSSLSPTRLCCVLSSFSSLPLGAPAPLAFELALSLLLLAVAASLQSKGSTDLFHTCYLGFGTKGRGGEGEGMVLTKWLRKWICIGWWCCQS